MGIFTYKTGSAIGGFLFLVLSGCGGSEVAAVRGLDIRGNDFNSELAREYQRLALFEADAMEDLRDADRFAEKSLKAAAGDIPLPEDTHRWQLPASAKTELVAARHRLLKASDTEAHALTPQAAAKAQASFDCWLEQLDENFQPTHIEACRRTFYNTLFQVENALPTAFVSFFDIDSAVITGDGLTAAAKATRKAIATETPETLDTNGHVHIVISGHTDRVGREAYNDNLSRKRAWNAYHQLVSLGISPKRISVRHFGEMHPLIETPDDVPHRKNRRVEITIGLASSL